MPKEVEAVVLEKTALNCLCTLNVHVRKEDWFIKRNVSYRNREEIKFLHRKIKECSDCGINSSSSNWSYTLKH